MILDSEIAAWTLALYDEAQWPRFAHVEKPDADDGVCWAVARPAEDVDLVIFRGSTTAEDWFRDFCCWPHDVATIPALGPVHAGFADGMLSATSAVGGWLLADQAVVAGHSLGAARAWVYAAMQVAAGLHRPARVVTFGSPRPGYAQLARLIGEIPARSYRNGPDPVTAVPFTLPGFPYVEPCPFTDIDMPPTPQTRRWPGALAFHQMELYAKGVAI